MLVFLPGWSEIITLHDNLHKSDLLRRRRVSFHMLHGSVGSTEQQQALKPLGPGQWKVVLATNIAETSITIPDIHVVIDPGLTKQNTLDMMNNISRLEVTAISQANAKQ